MYSQKKNSVYDLMWTDDVTYGDVHLEDEKQWSKYNFEVANTEMLLKHFTDWETEAKKLVDINLVLPAYDAVMKCSHLFNMLDARSAISVSERVSYVLRVRTLAKAVAEGYIKLLNEKEQK